MEGKYPKRRLTYSEPHDVITQKTEFFTVVYFRVLSHYQLLLHKVCHARLCLTVTILYGFTFLKDPELSNY
jgi:hypothetical protein